MRYKFNNNTITSTFIEEDCFPAIIQFSAEELNNRFIEYNFTDSDMFELVVSSRDNTLKQFTLTLCNHHIFETGLLSVPDAENGSIIIYDSGSKECEFFNVHVFNDGIRIDISSKSPIKHLKTVQLIFALDELDNIVSIYITNLNTNNIKHLKYELSEK